MPVIANAEGAEIPWRPGYRTFALAGREQGLGCIASYSVVEPGAGAPPHVHANVDEVFILLEGRLEFRLGEERHVVEENHTVAGTPHGFVALGATPARMFVFLPKHGEIAGATTYLEGGPPRGAEQH